MLIRKPAFILSLAIATATAALALAAGEYGLFEGATDVGNPARKGSVAFDSARGEYRIAGAGVNVWAKTDEFQFLWRKLTGNVSMTTTMHFVGTSPTAHRKAGLMIRASLEPDAPYVDAVVHGDGLTNLQYRETAGDITRGIRFPVEGPTQIRLEKRGNVYSLWYAREGEPLQEAGSTPVALGNGPLYAGLFVCSHNPELIETVVFSNVTIESLPAVAAKKAK
jgi:hypothetical protein